MELAKSSACPCGLDGEIVHSEACPSPSTVARGSTDLIFLAAARQPSDVQKLKILTCTEDSVVTGAEEFLSISSDGSSGLALHSTFYVNETDGLASSGVCGGSAHTAAAQEERLVSYQSGWASGEMVHKEGGMQQSEPPFCPLVSGTTKLTASEPVFPRWEESENRDLSAHMACPHDSQQGDRQKMCHKPLTGTDVTAKARALTIQSALSSAAKVEPEMAPRAEHCRKVGSSGLANPARVHKDSQTACEEEVQQSFVRSLVDAIMSRAVKRLEAATPCISRPDDPGEGRSADSGPHSFIHAAAQQLQGFRIHNNALANEPYSTCHDRPEEPSLSTADLPVHAIVLEQQPELDSTLQPMLLHDESTAAEDITIASASPCGGLSILPTEQIQVTLEQDFWLSTDLHLGTTHAPGFVGDSIAVAHIWHCTLSEHTDFRHIKAYLSNFSHTQLQLWL